MISEVPIINHKTKQLIMYCIGLHAGSESPLGKVRPRPEVKMCSCTSDLMRIIIKIDYTYMHGDVYVTAFLGIAGTYKDYTCTWKTTNFYSGLDMEHFH